MNVRYLFSSPNGDLPVDAALLARPFLLGPMQEHPHLRLGDYFRAIEQFVTGQGGEPLLSLLKRITSKEIETSDIHELMIRSEKHGGLYHLSSVEILGPELRHKFVVSAAVTEGSRQALQREFEILKLLNDSFRLPFIPEVYLLDTMALASPGAPPEMAMMMGEWFDGYHEWHLHPGDSGEPRLVIWDFRKGYRDACDREAFEIYRQSALILTLYYNVVSTHHIYPWLHAAGDFIVKSEGEKVDVRLTTVRGYEPLMVFLEEQDINRVMALITFFLNLTIRTRLDRWEGVGDVAWAPGRAVEPTVEGFFQALRIMEKEGRFENGVDGFAGLLRSFGQDELLRLSRPLLELYRNESGETAALVEERLESHCQTLWSAIHSARPQDGWSDLSSIASA
jgi:hypothetical protein